MATLKIRSDGKGRGTIEVDGQPLENVRAVSINLAVGVPDRVVVEFRMWEVDMETQVEYVGE